MLESEERWGFLHLKYVDNNPKLTNMLQEVKQNLGCKFYFLADAFLHLTIWIDTPCLHKFKNQQRTTRALNLYISCHDLVEEDMCSKFP